MKCPYCESGTNDFVPMNQTAEYSGIEMSVNRQGMLRVRVLDDDGGFTTQDIVEIRSCPLCGKRFVKGSLKSITDMRLTWTSRKASLKLDISMG